MNEVSLFYASCAQHLQLLRLILVYEKEVIFVPKSEFFVSKLLTDKKIKLIESSPIKENELLAYTER